MISLYVKKNLFEHRIERDQIIRNLFSSINFLKQNQSYLMLNISGSNYVIQLLLGFWYVLCDLSVVMM